MSLKWAQLAIAHVRNTVRMLSNNREFDTRQGGGGDVVAARSLAFTRRQQVPQDWQKELVAEVSAYVEKRAGNCEEMAKVAFVYLAENGLNPLEVAFFSGVGGRIRLFGTTNYHDVEPDHAFVIIGRKIGPQEARERTQGIISIPAVESWKFGAVICDPWSKRAYLAHKLALESEMINRVTAGRTRLCSEIRLEEAQQWHG
ncbi:MAG: hypothetical protein QOF63_1415 [Thermoanaerobaculia bacterium]|jgi:hypothetical protein|nr:hypothetical protein [Thermoanaerobaculia bacterium]MEA2414982.1 hypothetical protein [Thermoanaerobaculia bacterium]